MSLPVLYYTMKVYVECVCFESVCCVGHGAEMVYLYNVEYSPDIYHTLSWMLVCWVVPRVVRVYRCRVVARRRLCLFFRKVFRGCRVRYTVSDSVLVVLVGRGNAPSFSIPVITCLTRTPLVPLPFATVSPVLAGARSVMGTFCRVVVSTVTFVVRVAFSMAPWPDRVNMCLTDIVLGTNWLTPEYSLPQTASSWRLRDARGLECIILMRTNESWWPVLVLTMLIL